MFELVENRLFASADDSTLQAVVHKPANRPAVAASLNRDLARIQEWCNHWCLILNPNKTKALVVIRSGTMSHGELACLGFLSELVPTSTSLALSLTVSSPSKTMCEELFPVSQRICILRLVKRIFVDTSVLLRCYFPFILPILEYCSPVWGSAAECHLQHLERQVYSVARLCPDQCFLSWCHRRRVSGFSMLYKINSNSNHSMFSDLPSVSTKVQHTGAAAASHPLEF